MNCLHPINTDTCCSYGMGEVVYEGTTPKYKLEIDAGIPMTDFDFKVQLIGTLGSTTIRKPSMPVDDEDNYYVCFDTVGLGIGKVKAIVTTEINDTDFPDNVRRDVYVIENFIEIKKP